MQNSDRDFKLAAQFWHGRSLEHEGPMAAVFSEWSVGLSHRNPQHEVQGCMGNQSNFIINNTWWRSPHGSLLEVSSNPSEFRGSSLFAWKKKRGELSSTYRIRGWFASLSSPEIFEPWLFHPQPHTTLGVTSWLPGYPWTLWTHGGFLSHPFYDEINQPALEVPPFQEDPTSG